MTTLILLSQTLTERGRTQRAEIREFLESIGTADTMHISDVGFYKARMKYDPAAMMVMMKGYLAMELKWTRPKRYHGFRILAIDGSELTLPSNTRTERFATRIRGHADEADMPVQCKMSGLSDCINGLILDLLIDEYDHDEREHAERLTEAIPDEDRKDALITFDRGYFSFRLAFHLEDLGLNYLFRLNSYALKGFQKDMKPGDGKIIEAKMSRENLDVHRRKGKDMGTFGNRVLKARLVCIRVGNTIEFLLTNLDGNRMSRTCLKRLYHMRWDVETAFRTLKEDLKMNEYSGRRETLILQDIYCAAWILDITRLFVRSLGYRHKPTRKQKTGINFSNAIGMVKTKLAKALFHPVPEERAKAARLMREEIPRYVCPIRPGRSYSRDHACKNKSRMSYRSNY